MSYESIFPSFPRHVQANIAYEMKKMNEKEAEAYRNHIVSNAKNPEAIIFSPALFQNQIKAIDRQIFYLKHDNVERKGMICVNCKSTNTKTEQKQTRSGDEAMTTIVYCYDCKYKYSF